MNLIGLELKLSGDGEELLSHLSLSAQELDAILKEARTSLEDAEFRE